MTLNKLAFKEFAEEIASKLQEHYEGTTVTLREVMKNNGGEAAALH